MAININPGTPLRHVATFNATGNFVAPAGATIGFVSIHGATGGGGSGGSRGTRYANGPTSGGTGGSGLVAGAFVQLIPGGSHAVTIGAAGSGGTAVNGEANGSAGSSAGTTIFDGGALTVTGSTGGAGGNARTNDAATVGSQGSSSGQTSLPSLSPSAGTLTKTATISNQNTGAFSGGAGGSGGRYNSVAGSAGASAQVFVYI